MPATRTIGVKLDVRIAIQNHGDHWTAYVEPTGMTLRGRTKDESIQKAVDAVRFFVRTVGQKDGIHAVRKYLDYHKVLHSVVGEQPEPVVQQSHTIETHGLDVRLEVAGIA